MLTYYRYNCITPLGVGVHRACEVSGLMSDLMPACMATSRAKNHISAHYLQHTGVLKLGRDTNKLQAN
jgi:hypothetical protein